MRHLPLCIFISILLSLLFCTHSPESLVRDNPFDIDGSNFFPPTISMIDDTTTWIRDSLTLEVAGSDSSGFIRAFLWALNGSTYEDTTDSGRINVAFADSGIHTVRVMAIDNDGLLSSSAMTRITVLRGAPRVSSMHDSSTWINDTLDIGAIGSDTNGFIEKYLWALDSVSFRDTTMVGLIRTVFATSGVSIVKVKAVDDDGLTSPSASAKITVHLGRPRTIPRSDTIVSQFAIITMHVSAIDTNGTISRYYWDQGPVGWDDSTTDPYHTFSNSAGGSITIKWAVRDDDGLLSTSDTFAIRFNHSPTNPLVTAPDSFSGWSSYNPATGKGSLPLSFSASDPDSSSDTIAYTLQIGSTPDGLSQIYSGIHRQYELQNLDTNTRVYWRLRVQDKYGDSAVSNGSFISPTSHSASGLIAYYPLTGNADDGSGNSNNGIVNGVSFTTDRFGTANSALIFGGGNGVVSIPDNNLYHQTIGITISIWLLPNAGSQFVLQKGVGVAENRTRDGNGFAIFINPASASVGWALDIFDADTMWAFPETPKHRVATPIRSSITNWTHIVGSFDGSAMRIYVDGTLKNTTTESFTRSSNTDSLKLGINYWARTGQTFRYSGKMDDIRIYNRALTAEEVSALFHEGGW